MANSSCHTPSVVEFENTSTKIFALIEVSEVKVWHFRENVQKKTWEDPKVPNEDISLP